MQIEDKNNKWDSFLTNLQAKGRYSFTFNELKSNFNLSEESLLQGLYRYKKKKQIAQIRKGFYAVIPPRYLQQSMLPPFMFIDDLMKSLDKPYYVALLSAAAIYGAGHQQPMEYFVITETPAPRSIKNQKLRITFLSKNNWDKNGIALHKTDVGYIHVSIPELTALDLFNYAKKIGLNRIVTIVGELIETMKPSVLGKTAKEYTNTAAIQRLGYILDTEFSHKKLADSLWSVLNERNYYPIPLSSNRQKAGNTDNRWKVIKNMEIESDL